MANGKENEHSDPKTWNVRIYVSLLHLWYSKPEGNPRWFHGRDKLLLTILLH